MKDIVVSVCMFVRHDLIKKAIEDYIVYLKTVYIHVHVHIHVHIHVCVHVHVHVYIKHDEYIVETETNITHSH